MSKATIKYLLSVEGQKQSLLQGGDGKQQQVLECDVTPELLKVASISTHGAVSLDIGMHLSTNYSIDNDPAFGEYRLKADHVGIYFDAPQTAEALVAWEIARKIKVNAQLAELEPRRKKMTEEYQSKHEA